MVIAMVLFTVFKQFEGRTAAGVGNVGYSEFIQEVQARRIKSATISEGANGTEIIAITNDDRRIRTTATYLDRGLVGDLLANNVKFDVKPREESSFLMTLLVSWGPMLLLIGVWIYFMRQMQGGGKGGAFSFGKSKARMMDENNNTVTFADVAGCDEAKEEVREVVDFLRDPQRFQKLGGRIPRGLLLVGPPGTGKTLLAKSIAGEAKVPFFSISGSDFVEMFVGVGAARVRDMFENAKKNAPCIIFVDEIDAVGRQRGAGLGSGNDKREQTLYQMLVEMDGFETNLGVIVVAATNRPDILDAALLCPGRFDRQVVVGLPSLEERKEILLVHMRGKPIAEDVDALELAHLTPGFSGADLRNLVNEAALLAARNGEKRIRKEHFLKALDKIVLGLERSALKLSEEERRAVAYHEAGHAVVGEVLPHADKTEKVSIVPRGMALGARWSKPEERVLVSREHLMDELAVLMAGRVAEELFTGTVTTGAQDDFKRATGIAKRMVLDWGMGEHFKNVAWGSDSGPVFLGEEIAKKKDHSEETARLIDQDIMKILDEAYERARKVLSTHREAVHKIAEELLREETIPGDRVRAILRETQAVERAEDLGQE